MHTALRAGIVLENGMDALVFIETLYVLVGLAADGTRVGAMDVHVALQNRRLAELHWTLRA